MKPVYNANTIDLGPDRSFDLPHKCLHAGALYSLAGRMTALDSFHNAHGGDPEDEPCLVSVVIEDGRIFAHVKSGALTYKLEYVGSSWLLT